MSGAPRSDADAPSRRIALQSLSPARRQLVERHLRSRTAIRRRTPGSLPVITPAQRQLLILQETHGDLVAYNVAQAVSVSGSLDVPALRQALDDLVDRHEALRSNFSIVDGEPRVVVAPHGVCDFDMHEGVDDVDEFVRRAATRPFSLAQDVLLRARLAAVDNGYVLVLTTHHIVSDAVSKAVLFDELGELYRAHCDDRAPELARAPVEFADWAAWMADRVEHSGDLTWWCEHLADAPVETQLPTDHPRPDRAEFAGANLTHWLDPELTSAVEAFARQRRTTPFVVLLAAYAGLLYRYSGQEQIVVGSPTTGRHLAEVQRVVGLFINTLPIKLDASGSPSFDVLVDRAAAANRDAFRHEHVPFERIVEALRPVRHPARNPVYQTTFTLRPATGSAPKLADLDVTPIAYDGGWTKLDLTVVCHPSRGGTGMLWQYSTALFDRPTVQRLASHFERIVRAGIADPDQPVHTLPLADEHDLASMQQWNETTDDQQPALVHELVERQVRRRPDGPAVGDASGWLTYRQLDERANRLAHRLIAQGVRVEDRVAVLVERSIDLEVTLLAVLKAGAAYVPLDADYPADRLEFMLADSGARVLVVSPSLLQRAPHHSNVIECSDDAGPTAISSPPVTGVAPSNLAYVIYTSGSTGRPKGVEIEHRQISNQLGWMQRTLHLDEDDTFLQKTPVSFDLSGWEVLLAPVCGARLFMAKPDRRLDAGYLVEVMRRERVTVIATVPTALGVLADAAGASSIGSLRSVLACGEPLSDELNKLVATVWPQTELWNFYGPTEAAIGITFERCRSDQTVTVGRPMANCQVYVLDDVGNQQPIGMPGELHLGGAQVARGYHERPELTDARFVRTGFGRLYRTGDRAVWLADGRMQFVGRIDDQVKLRGYRIELGEVEARLEAHPSVRLAGAVVATIQRDAMLVAYVEASAPGGPSSGALEQDLLAVLRQQLPYYMVPQWVKVLPALPLTPTGKLDRRALAERPVAPAVAAVPIGPETPTQRVLLDLWRDGLGLTGTISIDDSFFDIGGTSLSALTLFPRLERRLRIKLPLAFLFEHVTIRSLAEAIDAELLRSEAWNVVVPIREGGEKRPVFFMPEFRGDVLTYRQLAAHLDPQRPAYGIQCAGLDGRQAPRLSIEDIARDCMTSMRSIQPHGPYLLVGYCFGGLIAFEAAAMLRAEGDEVDFLGVIEATPFEMGEQRQRVRAALRTVRQSNPTPLVRRIMAVRSVDHFMERVRANLRLRTWPVRVKLLVAVGQLGPRVRRRLPYRWVDVKEANRVALGRYVAGRSSVFVDYFRASSGETDKDEARRNRWLRVASLGVEMHLIAGEGISHFQVIRQEHVEPLAAAMNAAMKTRS